MTNDPIRESSPIPYLHVYEQVLCIADARAEDPKPFDLVPSRDSVYLIPLRTYLVMHAHVLLNLPPKRRVRRPPPTARPGNLFVLPLWAEHDHYTPSHRWFQVQNAIFWSFGQISVGRI